MRYTSGFSQTHWISQKTLFTHPSHSPVLQVTSKEFEQVKEATGFSSKVEMLDNENAEEVGIHHLFTHPPLTQHSFTTHKCCLI